MTGYVALTIGVVAGVAALVAGSPLALTTLMSVGAGYLMWLGIGALTRPVLPQAATTGAAEGTGSWVRQAVTGAGVSGLNPKALLLFLALLPQFTDPAAPWPFATQITVLGLVHTASCAVVYTLVGVGARRVLRARPAAARAVTRFSGVAMIALGVGLLAEQLLQ